MKILNISNLSVGGFTAIVDHCDRRLLSREGAFLIPMNPIKVVKARRHPEFQAVIDGADRVFADSFGIRLAATILHREKIPITPGYQVMFRLLAMAEEKGKSVFLLGTTDESLRLASDRIRELHPGLKIAGSHHGFFSPEEEGGVLAWIAACHPDFVFVAMGEQRQEMVINRFRRLYPQAVCMGVGGSIDLIAGKQPKPPQWIQRHYLEWLYRFFRQPFRIPRFKALPIFLFLVLRERVGMK